MKNIEITKELSQELKQSWIDDACIIEFEGCESQFHQLMGKILFQDDLHHVKKIIDDYMAGNVKGEPYSKEGADEWLTLNIVEKEIKKLKEENNKEF